MGVERREPGRAVRGRNLRAVSVGDRLVVLADCNRMGGGSAVVARIGRKYVTTDSGRRFDRDSGQEAGNGVGGYCYAMTEADAAAHQEHARDVGALESFVNARRYRWTQDLTADQARRVLAILMESPT